MSVQTGGMFVLQSIGVMQHNYYYGKLLEVLLSEVAVATDDYVCTSAPD